MKSERLVDMRWIRWSAWPSVRRKGSLLVRDVRRANRTTVNGQPIEEIVLRVGDEVGIAGHRFRVVWKGRTGKRE